MRFGTPLSPAAIKVMLLGSGELGKEVVIELQRLGVETIAVDRYAGAPAHQVAHRSHVIDMTDAKALRALVEKERPHFLVPEIEALATDELVRIEADGLCTVIPTARAAHITMNRERIRVLAAEELKLPTSPYAFCSSLEELQAAAVKIGFPCFVKPVMSSSGKGQTQNTNDFSGVITATVIGVLPNGHLLVRGEKQIGVNQNVDTLQFTGQVDPQTIAPGNVVQSAQIANVRIQQSGEGAQADAQAMGWLSRFFLNLMPV